MAWIKFIWDTSDSDELVLEWVDALGWTHDPFEENITENISQMFSDFTQERSKINLFIINQEKFGIIRGEHGMGKTILLRWLHDELEIHSTRVIPVYIDRESIHDPELLVRTFAYSVTGIIGRLFGSFKNVRTRHDLVRYVRKHLGKRRLFLLLDDIAQASAESVVFFQQLFEEKVPLQMIVAGTKTDLEKSPIAKMAMPTLQLHLTHISAEGAREMIQKRIESVGGEGIYPFTSDVMDKIISHTAGNPKEILKECRKLAIRSSINRKAEPDHPPVPEAQKQKEPEKKEKIKEKITTIDYTKESPKKHEKKPSVEVIESKHKKHSDDEDMEEKERNDRLIHELFDGK